MTRMTGKRKHFHGVAHAPTFTSGLLGTCLALCVVLWGLPSFAQQAAVYTVSGIAVDQTAQTAEQARDLALQEGKRKAFQAVIDRLVPQGYETQYPRLTDAALDGLIRGVEVFDEKRSNVRYLADLKVTFQPADVRGLLRRSGLPFSETKSKPLMVFPVMQYGYEQTLWGNPNPWRVAWERREQTDFLVPVIVPSGDLQDRGLVTARAARQGARERLDAVRARYDAGEILVVYAKYTDERPLELELTVDYYGGAGTRSTVRSFTRPPEVTDLAGFMDIAVADVHDEIIDQWKGRTLIQLGTLSRLIARVPLATYPEWLSIRRKLDQVSVMDRVTVTSLTNLEGRLDMRFYGDPEQLAVALAQEDLLLDRASGMWTLSLRSR